METHAWLLVLAAGLARPFMVFMVLVGSCRNMHVKELQTVSLFPLMAFIAFMALNAFMVFMADWGLASAATCMAKHNSKKNKNHNINDQHVIHDRYLLSYSALLSLMVFMGLTFIKQIGMEMHLNQLIQYGLHGFGLHGHHGLGSLGFSAQVLTGLLVQLQNTISNQIQWKMHTMTWKHLVLYMNMVNQTIQTLTT